MNTKYDNLTLTHNLLGVILPAERYENIYLNRLYLIPPVISLHNDKIDKDVTKTEVHQSKVKYESNRNDRALY